MLRRAGRVFSWAIFLVRLLISARYRREFREAVIRLLESRHALAAVRARAIRERTGAPAPITLIKATRESVSANSNG